jgi:hypothetical protein
VIELTSSSTRKDDTDRKLTLYRDVLKVKEYFLLDPNGDYLNPRLQGHRLRGGEYHPIRAVNGRLPSQVLGLHLQQDGNTLRLWDPDAEAYLLTPGQLLELTQQQLEQARQRIAELAQGQQRIAELEQRVAHLEALITRLGGQANGPS